MPRKNRLTRADFQAFSGKTPRIHGEFFSVSIGPARIAKAAVVVSKKVSNKAVDRNLIKRRIRATLRTLSLPSVSLIFTAKKGAHGAAYKDIASDIRSLLSRI
jgi:ribonuclease P protein component